MNQKYILIGLVELQNSGVAFMFSCLSLTLVRYVPPTLICQGFASVLLISFPP